MNIDLFMLELNAIYCVYIVNEFFTAFLIQTFYFLGSASCGECYSDEWIPIIILPSLTCAINNQRNNNDNNKKKNCKIAISTFNTRKRPTIRLQTMRKLSVKLNSSSFSSKCNKN